MSFDFGPMNDAVMATFGREVLLYLFGGKTIVGIYESHFFAVVGGEIGGTALVTTVTCKAADVAGVIEEDTELTLLVPATGTDRICRVKEIRPDAEGYVVLDLEVVRDA